MEEFVVCSLSEAYKWILLPLTYSLVFLVGLGLNGALLWSVVSRTRSWSCTIIYLTNLAVADLLYVLALPLLIISYALRNEWPFGNMICKAVRFFFLANLHGSMGFLTCVSVHRFLGVCYPITSLRIRTRRLAVFISGSVWVVVTVEVLPTLVYARTGLMNNLTVCFEMTDPRHFSSYFPYGLFLTTAGFVLPFLVVVTCYCAIIRTLYSRTGTNNPHVRTPKMRYKSLHTLMAVCLIFVLCFVPYHVARTVNQFVRVYMPEDCRAINVVMISYKVWKPIVSLNCCANPLLYFFGSDCHRKRLRAWLLRKSKRVHPAMNLVETTSRR